MPSISAAGDVIAICAHQAQLLGLEKLIGSPAFNRAVECAPGEALKPTSSAIDDQPFPVRVRRSFLKLLAAGREREILHALNTQRRDVHAKVRTRLFEFALPPVDPSAAGAPGARWLDCGEWQMVDIAAEIPASAADLVLGFAVYFIRAQERGIVARLTSTSATKGAHPNDCSSSARTEPVGRGRQLE